MDLCRPRFPFLWAETAEAAVGAGGHGALWAPAHGAVSPDVAASSRSSSRRGKPGHAAEQGCKPV